VLVSARRNCCFSSAADKHKPLLPTCCQDPALVAGTRVSAERQCWMNAVATKRRACGPHSFPHHLHSRKCCVRRARGTQQTLRAGYIPDLKKMAVAKRSEAEPTTQHRNEVR